MSLVMILYYKIMNKGKMDVVTKTGGEISNRPLAEHTQWLIKISYPLAEQAVIVGFYNFWKHKNEIFRQYYKRLKPKNRIWMKQRAWICQQYSKRYLGGGTLELWYMHFIITMDYTVPNEPLVELQQQQLRPILQRIYATHDPDFQEPTFPQDGPSKQKIIKKRKGFFGCLAMIFNVFTKLQGKEGETQIQAHPFITRQYQEND